ncbi:MAG: Co2+/Mg2+ efflux protein ApaG [Phycisphaera sp.]|nr:MAG: Co2+/Mg2+ efflux protein ApaG [Phycisphaera sp.]
MDPHAIGLTSSADPGQHGSDTITPVKTDAGEASVRVRVRPEYLPSRSDPRQPMHVFAYHITIDYQAETGAPMVQLVDRYWRIVDAHGTEQIAQGEGLVGQQPTLRPGEQFEYASYSPIRTSWGTMEGRFGLVLLDGRDQPTSRQIVDVGRFYLVSE